MSLQGAAPLGGRVPSARCAKPMLPASQRPEIKKPRATHPLNTTAYQQSKYTAATRRAPTLLQDCSSQTVLWCNAILAWYQQPRTPLLLRNSHQLNRHHRQPLIRSKMLLHRNATLRRRSRCCCCQCSSSNPPIPPPWVKFLHFLEQIQTGHPTRFYSVVGDFYRTQTRRTATSVFKCSVLQSKLHAGQNPVA